MKNKKKIKEVSAEEFMGIKKVRKPINLKLPSMVFWHDEELDYIRVDRIIIGAMDLTDAKRLHKWLGQAIAYLEQGEK